jgi:hypothetical protein
MRASFRISLITVTLLENVHNTVTEEKVDGPEYEISNFYVPSNI